MQLKNKMIYKLSQFPKNQSQTQKYRLKKIILLCNETKKIKRTKALPLIQKENNYKNFYKKFNHYVTYLFFIKNTI